VISRFAVRAKQPILPHAPHGPGSGTGAPSREIAMTNAACYFAGSPIEPRVYRPFALSPRQSLLAALLFGAVLVHENAEPVVDIARPSPSLQVHP
jgi:hypothetical protein